jgi:hypothetical protein
MKGQVRVMWKKHVYRDGAVIRYRTVWYLGKEWTGHAAAATPHYTAVKASSEQQFPRLPGWSRTRRPAAG